MRAANQRRVAASADGPAVIDSWHSGRQRKIWRICSSDNQISYAGATRPCAASESNSPTSARDAKGEIPTLIKRTP